MRLALFMTTKGPIVFQGKELICSLPDTQKRISSYLAMAGGQSVETLLKMTNLRGRPVRDAYSVARTVIESYVNASYLLSESAEVSERAIRYIDFANFRHYNRSYGNGDFKIDVMLDVNSAEEIKLMFPEFSGKGKSSWTNLDVPSRITKVGELAGAKSGSRLIAAYALIYSISSEIIHGSPFGAAYFYSAHIVIDRTNEAFCLNSIKHLEEILVAVLHAGGGYLLTFFGLQNIEGPISVEAEIHKTIMELINKPPSAFPPYDLNGSINEL